MSSLVSGLGLAEKDNSQVDYSKKIVEQDDRASNFLGVFHHDF
jgi:hypothetical protein